MGNQGEEIGNRGKGIGPPIFSSEKYMRGAMNKSREYRQRILKRIERVSSYGYNGDSRITNANPEGCNQHTGPGCSGGMQAHPLSGIAPERQCAKHAIDRITGKSVSLKARSMVDTIIEAEDGGFKATILKGWRGKLLKEAHKSKELSKGSYMVFSVDENQGTKVAHVATLINGEPHNFSGWWDSPITGVVRFDKVSG